MGRPPPLFRAMPERKRFFSIEVFPKLHDQLNDCRFGTTILRHGLQFLVNLQVEDFPSTIQS